MTTRPLPPLDLPVVLGEAIRVTVVLELTLMVMCCVFVGDRLRRRIPAPMHKILWAACAVAVGVIAGVVGNVLTTPPTTGIYLTVAGTTVGAALSGWAAVQTHLDH